MPTIQTDGELLEVDEKTVDRYGRINIGTEHSGKKLKIYVIQEP